MLCKSSKLEKNDYRMNKRKDGRNPQVIKDLYEENQEKVEGNRWRDGTEKQADKKAEQQNRSEQKSPRHNEKGTFSLYIIYFM